jgi:hypothetical protein
MTRAEQARYLAERSKPNRPAKSPRRGDAADTSRPGAAATARKAGAGEARNMKKNGSSKATFAPEASKGKPSRKSTRQSANRVKAASNLTRRQQRRVRSPAARAARGA